MVARHFVERAELVLMACFGLSFLLIIQLYSKVLFQAGLALLIVSTLLEIGVGNIPGHSGVGSALGYLVLFLALIAAVFGLGIILVPYLTGLGR